MSRLSPEERERTDRALAEARAALEKVFESFVICARFEDMNVRSAIRTDWHGPYSDVVGLAQIAVWRFQEQERDNHEKPNHDDPE